MDMFEEGKKAQKSFKSINSSRDFEKYVFDFLLKDRMEFKAADFVRGMLDKTKNETLYIYAKTVADRFEKNESIWGNIIYAFNLLVKGKNKPGWGFSFLSSTLHHRNFRIHNYDAEKVVKAVINYDGEGSAWWLEKTQNEDWFKANRDSIKRAVLTNAENFHSEKSISLFAIFKDMYFYREFIEKNDNTRLFEQMLVKIKEHGRKIEGFVGGFEIDDIMKTYSDKFRPSAQSINILTDLLKEYNTPESGKLFVDLLGETGFTDESNFNWLMKIKDAVKDTDNSMKMRLYELSGKEEFLPDEVKDVFLF